MARCGDGPSARNLPIAGMRLALALKASEGLAGGHLFSAVGHPWGAKRRTLAEEGSEWLGHPCDETAVAVLLGTLKLSTPPCCLAREISAPTAP
eukprot:scaffold50397_cov33-Phaeocystis_antarctica.AAC.1